MGFSRQEQWNGFPFLSSGGIPNPGNEPGSPALQADSLPCELPGNIDTNDVYSSYFISHQTYSLCSQLGYSGWPIPDVML